MNFESPLEKKKNLSKASKSIPGGSERQEGIMPHICIALDIYYLHLINKLFVLELALHNTPILKLMKYTKFGDVPKDTQLGDSQDTNSSLRLPHTIHLIKLYSVCILCVWCTKHKK